LPIAPANTQTSLSFEITSELPKRLENTDVPDTSYKPIQPTLAQDGLKEYTSSTTELNKRIPIPTDPTPLILQPPTAIIVPKNPSFIPKGDKMSVWNSTANPVNSTTASHSTLFPFAVSKKPNPAVTELNKAVVNESVNTLNNKTWSTSSTTLKVPTVSIPRTSSLISKTFPVSEQSSTPVQAPAVTQIYPKATQSTRKPVNLSTITMTKLIRTTETSTTTVPRLISRGSTMTTETPELTEQLQYSVSSTAVPWMKVTRGKQLTEVTKRFKPLAYFYTYGIFAQQMMLAICMCVTGSTGKSEYFNFGQQMRFTDKEFGDECWTFIFKMLNLFQIMNLS